MSSKLAVAGLMAGILVGMSVAHADVLDDVKARGTLVVGVKADYRPFGFRDPSGAIIGLEPDLAADVAKKLGVKLELVPVVSANRMEFLKQGKIDLMIATMSDTPERRKIVQVIEPLYYADFVNVLLRKGAPVKSWEDLKGKKICGTTGACSRSTTPGHSPQPCVSTPCSTPCSNRICIPTQMPSTGRPPERRRPMIRSPRIARSPRMHASNAPTPGTSRPSAAIAASRSPVSSTDAPARSTARTAERRLPEP